MIGEGSPHFKEVIMEFANVVGVGGFIVGLVVESLPRDGDRDISVKLSNKGRNLKGDRVGVIKIGSGFVTSNPVGRCPMINVTGEPEVFASQTEHVKFFGSGSIGGTASVTSIGLRVNGKEQGAVDNHLVFNTQHALI